MTLNRKARKNESGSILVELTLVVPLLMLIVAGMIEVGAAWRDKSTVIQASRQGARVASHLGSVEEADMAALSSVLAVMPTGNPNDGLSKDLAIKKVVIFDANLTDVQIADCKSRTTNGGVNDRCNVYIKGTGGTGDRLLTSNLTINNFDGTSNDWDIQWSPVIDRSQDVVAATELGVYVEAERPFLTNIFPGQQTQTITAFTIMRLEPPTP